MKPYLTAIFAPGYTSEQYPKGLDDIADDTDKLIDAFEKRYVFWFLQPAQCLSQDSNNGFAVLSILNPYLDMIAQLKNKIDEKVIEENKKAETKAYYFAGIEDVFPAIAHHEKSREIKLLLYKRLRNGLAHMSFTGINIYLNDDIQEPYLILDDEDLHIVISPRYWTYAIFTHFTNYMAELKNPDSVYRDNFRKRILRAT